MKRKVLNGFFLTLLALVGLSSCQTSNVQEVNGGGEASSGVITFTFVAPKGTPTTYAIHDQPEWAIKDNKITLYEFLAENDSYVGTHTLNLTDKGNAQYEVEVAVSQFTGAQGNIHPGKNRKFLFVANGNDLGQLTSSETLATIRQRVIAKEQQANASSKTILLDDKYLPMEGLAKTQSGTSVASTSIPLGGANVMVDLIRAVARIDVQTTMQPTVLNPNRPKVVITDVVLNSTMSNSSIGKQNLTARGGVRNGVKPFHDLPSGGIDPTINGGLFKKAFYLYETYFGGDTPKVEISFRYGQDPGLYKVTADFKNIGVERNTLYTIILGDTDPDANITAAIVANDWEKEEKVRYALNFVAPSGTPTGLPSGVNFDKRTHTLTVPAAGVTSAISIPFASQFKGSNNQFAASLKADKDGVVPRWVTVDSAETANVVINTIGANTTGQERTAVVRVEDNTAQGIFAYYLVVKQPAN